MDLLSEYKEKIIDANRPQSRMEVRDGVEIWEERDPLTMSTTLTASIMVMGKQCCSRVVIPDRNLLYNPEESYGFAREKLIRQLEEYVNQEIERSTEVIQVRGGRDNQVIMTFRR